MYSDKGLGCCGGGAPSGLGAWWTLAPVVLDTWNSITSSKCWTGYNRKAEIPCADTPNYDAVVRAVERAPESEVQKIVNYLRAANYGRGPKNRAELLQRECLPHWVKAILGGADCRASKFPEAPGFFRDFVRAYGAPETPQDELPGSGIPPGYPRGADLAPIVAAGLALVFLPKLFGKKTRRA